MIDHINEQKDDRNKPGKRTFVNISEDANGEIVAGANNKLTANRDERRMEINRIRAKEIRKRKKKMEEDMQKQIIQLTLENNKLRTQVKMQQAEMSVLRNNQLNITNQNQQQQQQQYLPMNYHGHLVRNPVNLTNMAPQNMLDNNGISGLAALNNFVQLPAQQGNQAYPNATHSSLAAQAGMSNGMLLNNAHEFSFLNSVNPQQQVGPGLGEKDDINQQQLAKLLANSSTNVKHSLLEKLRTEEIEAIRKET